MPVCKKCGNKFLCKISINNKIRNLGNRTYCLNCSPFGSHNTKRIHEIVLNKDGTKKCCKKCGNEFNKHQRRGHVCWSCYQKDRTAKVRDKVHSIVGEKCCICNYSNGVAGRKILDFHHMRPSEKLFDLSIRNMCNLNWDKVINEIKKCLLVCCRCHREIEYGIIDKHVVEKLYRKFLDSMGD